MFPNITETISYTARWPLTNHSPDFYIPIFTLIEFICYMGWIKVAETLLNPFGDDDEDFDYDGQLDDEGYELDDEYDEGNMMDVKPPVGVNAGNNATGIPIDNGEKYVYVLIEYEF